MLPKTINSKKKFDNGPSNNKRFTVPHKKAFGFVAAEESSNESCNSEKIKAGKKIFGKKINGHSEDAIVGQMVKDPNFLANKLRDVL